MVLLNILRFVSTQSLLLLPNRSLLVADKFSSEEGYQRIQVGKAKTLSSPRVLKAKPPRGRKAAILTTLFPAAQQVDPMARRVQSEGHCILTIVCSGYNTGITLE